MIILTKMQRLHLSTVRFLVKGLSNKCLNHVSYFLTNLLGHLLTKLVRGQEI